jgi:RNA polymerase sigma factor (TIGR02999 family)
VHLLFRFRPSPANLGAVKEAEPTQPSTESDDPQAAGQLLKLVYDELRRLAAAKLAHESPGQTLQPTALVHEAWLRLGGDRQPSWANRAHFFAAAAEGMRRILIDNARRKRALRHGGALAKISANSTGFDLATPAEDDAELLLLNEALDALAAHDARKAELVKQKYFTGLTLEETAAVLGISLRTAKRDWTYARAWLFNEVRRLRG